MNKCVLAFTILLLFSSCHVGRFIRWNFADHKDNKKFASVEVKASKNHYNFPQSVGRFHFPDSTSQHSPIEDFDTFLKKNGTLAFIVLRQDTVLYEKYFNPASREYHIPSFSVSKSLISILLAIAIDEGKIGSIHDSITDYLTYLKPEFKGVKIVDLLNMRSGIRFSESYVNPFGGAAKLYYGRDFTLLRVSRRGL